MGQAAVDLPDPLQAPPEGAKTSTDELLAQLAGDEIDRLLAEADGGPPPASRAPFHIALPTRPGHDARPEAPTDRDAPAPVVETTKPGPTELDVAAEMDALFTAAAAKDAAAVADAKARAEAETTAAERDGLKAAAALSSPSAAPVLPADDDAPLPVYLRPLEWLNAPLTLLPESVRDVVGKIAIITLLNAAVILAYVMVVRRAQ